jgi:hypothetical protein
MIPMEARKAEGRESDKSQEKLTWDKLEQIGLGELGMTYKEMWSLTPRSFFNAVNGSQKKRLRIENDYDRPPHHVCSSTM